MASEAVGTLCNQEQTHLSPCRFVAQKLHAALVTIRQTKLFSAWLADLRDVQAKARINARIRRLSLGNPGQGRALSGGIAEMKIDYGPGYRVYYTQRGQELVILLCGGDKRTQDQDIAQAVLMAREV